LSETRLDIGCDIRELSVWSRSFCVLAQDPKEYTEDVLPTPKFLEKLRQSDIDVFVFRQRTWLFDWFDSDSPFKVKVHKDNVALLDLPEVDGFEYWFRGLKSETRTALRKASKSGLETRLVAPSEDFALDVWKIYNETPFRQGRKFHHYGMTIDKVRNYVFNSSNLFIGAFLSEKLVGFAELAVGEETVLLSQILSLTSARTLRINNSLIAKTVEVCISRGLFWIVYGRFGNHPSLDAFKANNGFVKYEIRRFYVPLTKKGQVLIWLGLHRELEDSVPSILKRVLIPLYYKFGQWRNK
jgi:hypothetical protein